MANAHTRQPSGHTPAVPLLGGWRAALAVALFVAVAVAANRIVMGVRDHVVGFDAPDTWPMGIFSLRIPQPVDVAMAMLAAGLFALALWWLPRRAYNRWLVTAACAVLIVTANQVQSILGGLGGPVTGSESAGEGMGGYYTDALDIDSPAAFVAGYVDLQPGLLVHSRTHPPGAVLTFYLLDRLFAGRASLIGAALAISSAALAALFMHRVIVHALNDGRLAGYAAFLLALTPAVSIYTAVSLDALIGAALLGTLAFFLHEKWAISVAGMLVCLLAASSLTFGFVFILPVLALFDLLHRRSIRRTAAALAGVVLFYLALLAVTGFNYAESFRLATSLENPEGFMLVAEPVNYVFTRLENVLEMAVFLGPFLLMLGLRGLTSRRGQSPALWLLSVLGIGTLLAMFLTGAFRTGETARAALFAYPYLLFPVILCLRGAGDSPAVEARLAALVFGQTLIMQLFGWYFW